MTKGHKKKIWEIDREYIAYQKNHYPEAIEFIRRNAKGIKNAGNIWFDVQTVTEFSSKAPDGSYLSGVKNKILFKKIIFDIFPRKIKPQYVEENDFYNRYTTWKTATKDIQAQRSAGYDGERWIVECLLDQHKMPSKIRKELVPETKKRIENPAYSTYLRSKAYNQYEAEYAAYESRLGEYKDYRHRFHDFHLPDGEVRQVLLYDLKRVEEKFEMLRQLGVKETEIQERRQRLVKPVEPIPPPAPPREIEKTVPAHYEDRTVPGKWAWNHSIKSVRRA